MEKHFLELIRRASTELPDDVIKALQKAKRNAAPETPAKYALQDMLKNCGLSKVKSTPICQDTGANIWRIYHPADFSEKYLTRQIHKATCKATHESEGLHYLRPNVVNSITGENTGDNVGGSFPIIQFEQWDRKTVVADLLMKGGGSENVSAQYALPDTRLKAGRDLEGVRRVILDAVFQAQGKGCSPGIVGVGIGGDRILSYTEARDQLFRLVNDKNPNSDLAKLEKRLYKECNELDIGPMGYGGGTTVLGVKIGYRYRLPASFFVSMSYICWTCRRASVMISHNNVASFSQISQIAHSYILPETKGRK